MVNFNAIPKYHNFTCQSCGQNDRGPEGSTTCSECRLYLDHPESAPGYFTWTKTSSGWAATALWRDKNPDPQPGTTITVHRRDGSSSEHTTRELLNSHYNTDGNKVVTCTVI